MSWLWPTEREKWASPLALAYPQDPTVHFHGFDHDGQIDDAVAGLTYVSARRAARGRAMRRWAGRRGRLRSAPASKDSPRTATAITASGCVRNSLLWFLPIGSPHL